MIVMGKMSHEKTDWVEQLLPEYEPKISGGTYAKAHESQLAPLHLRRQRQLSASTHKSKQGARSKRLSHLHD